MWRRVAKDSLVFVAGAGLVVVLQVAFRLVSIHNLSKSDYGRAALLISIYNGAILAANFGIPVATARLAARSTGTRRARELLVAAAKASMLPCAATALVLGIVTYEVAHSLPLAVVCGLGVPPMVGASLCAGFVRGKGFLWGSAGAYPANAAAQLVALSVVIALGVNVGVGWVLVSFCI